MNIQDYLPKKQPDNNPAFQDNQNIPLPTKEKPVAMDNKNQKMTVILLILIALFLGVAVAAVKTRTKIFPKAESQECAPSGIKEEITANSAEINFETARACQTQIVFGTSPDALLLKIPENMAVLNHKIKLSPLLPSTTYYYQIVTKDEKELSPIKSFLTKSPENQSASVNIPTPIPTVNPVENCSPEEFQKYYGTSNADYDFDKNGIVNSVDLILCRKNKNK